MREKNKSICFVAIYFWSISPFIITMVAVPGLEGLDENTIEVSKGGESFEWMSFDQRKLYTNAFIVQDGKVCIPSVALLTYT